MKTIIILAMHGIPPNDYPKRELNEFFQLHAMVEEMGSPVPPPMMQQHAWLDKKIRNWPRNSYNDPFQQASNELAKKLGEVSNKSYSWLQ